MTLQDMDSELVLAQKLECTTEHTLQDLYDEIVCCSREVPAPAEPLLHDKAYRVHWTGPNDAGALARTEYPQFSGESLDSDVCVMVDSCLYGKHPPSHPSSYVTSLLQHNFTADSPLHGATYGGSTLEETKLGNLPRLCVRQPYWLMHVGDCEHIWLIENARYVNVPYSC